VEVEAIEVGGGVYAEGSRVERGVVVVEVSVPPCIARAVAGSCEVAEMWGFSVAVWWAGWNDTGTYISLSSGGTSVKLSST